MAKFHHAIKFYKSCKEPSVLFCSNFDSSLLTARVSALTTTLRAIWSAGEELSLTLIKRFTSLGNLGHYLQSGTLLTKLYQGFP